MTGSEIIIKTILLTMPFVLLGVLGLFLFTLFVLKRISKDKKLRRQTQQYCLDIRNKHGKDSKEYLNALTLFDNIIDYDGMTFFQQLRVWYRFNKEKVIVDPTMANQYWYFDEKKRNDKL